MKGIVYGVGVGPGDAELMTLKAVRLIKETDVIAVPGSDAKRSAAYRIARQAVPEIDSKDLIAVPMPMTHDPSRLAAAHKAGAELIKSYLDRGKNMVYLTLGDPGVYSSFSYLQDILQRKGCAVEQVSAVTSFCAAAARLGIPLAEGRQAIHILPELDDADASSPDGTLVLMKSGGRIGDVKKLLRGSGRKACAVINCGMEGETLCRSLDEIPDEAGYFTIVISKPDQ